MSWLIIYESYKIRDERRLLEDAILDMRIGASKGIAVSWLPQYPADLMAPITEDLIYRTGVAMRHVRRWLALLFMLFGVALEDARASAQVAHGPLLFAEVDGTLTSVTIGYLRRALHQAEASDASALIIQLGSSGG